MPTLYYRFRRTGLLTFDWNSGFEIPLNQNHMQKIVVNSRIYVASCTAAQTADTHTRNYESEGGAAGKK